MRSKPSGRLAPQRRDRNLHHCVPHTGLAKREDRRKMKAPKPTTSSLFLLLLSLVLHAPGASLADQVVPTEKGKDAAAESLPTVAAKTADFDPRNGFLAFHVDHNDGRIWLELPPPGARGVTVSALYLEGLRSGLGSNPVGLDRGQLGEARLIHIRRIGPRVLFEVPNLRFRALTDRVDEQRATEESFATSVIWGTKIAALDVDGRSLIDLSEFLLRDAHNVIATLESTEQGEFSLDPTRSAVELADCLAFPDNIELEATLTFTGRKPGPHVAAIAPVPEAVTLVQHQSLIRLPDDGYRPRVFDPRQGMYSVDFLDYAAELDEPVRNQWIARHRLEKTDPSADRSTVKEPLVYYVDRGAPEPVRSALIEGASWWADAFDGAGLIDAYRVELLPPGAHPLDVRYNVIQWVHRSTRGWSYGAGVTDPRTGEIVKGHVSLGSLRVRQDRLLFEGLAGTVNTGSGTPDDPIELALARIRQLAAHEVGHTLGITHNFAASTYGRESVMDYPAPLIGIDASGRLDFSQAYAVGIGAWDTQTIRYGYSQFAPSVNEADALDGIVQHGIEQGLLFLTDADARPASAADPRANLWDNGDDAVAGLEHALVVRQAALRQFGEHNVRPGQPIAELQEVLAPVYFHHRYQLDAAAKTLGGMRYSYAVRGDGQVATEVVAGDEQRRALEVISRLLEPAELDIPASILALLAPRPWGSEDNREMFGTTTWPSFDALGAAGTAAGQAVGVLLEPKRLARLDDFHSRDASLPSIEDVLSRLVTRAFGGANQDNRQAALRHVSQRVLVDHLIGTTSTAGVLPRVQVALEQGLRSIHRRLDGATGAHGVSLRDEIARFLGRGYAGPPTVIPPLAPPPGSPIGAPSILGACDRFEPWRAR